MKHQEVNISFQPIKLKIAILALHLPPIPGEIVLVMLGIIFIILFSDSRSVKCLHCSRLWKYLISRLFSLLASYSTQAHQKNYLTYLCVIDEGEVGCTIYLFTWWSCRMAALMLCYHSIVSSIDKGDISASAICPL